MADKVQGETIPVEARLPQLPPRGPVGIVGHVDAVELPADVLRAGRWRPRSRPATASVMKPAEITPLLSSLRIAELMAEVGPAARRGQHAAGARAAWRGQHLAEHPGIAKIAFTGSTATGRRDRAGLARATSRSVQLELGGKGAEHRVRGRRTWQRRRQRSAFWAIFHNQGQACIAGSPADAARADRRGVPRAVHCRSPSRSGLGNPLDEATEMGPLTSAAAARRAC